MQCKLEFLFYLTRSAEGSIAHHRHGCHELVYYLSGRGKTDINGMEYTFRQGTFAIIQPNMVHDERHEKETDVLFIGFRYSDFPLMLENGLYADTPQKDILRVLQKLKAEMLEKKAFYEHKLESLLQELIIEIARTRFSDTDTTRGFSHIQSLLMENYAQDMDFNTLAELSGYSYHRFRHIFKELHGVSPYQYVLQLRLHNAGKMLGSTHHSVLRIAQECGFSSQSQFCSLFKRMFGCTPGEYREKQMHRR